jgi:hypothetical protein
LSYIGRKPTVGNFQICDAISVVNGQAAYTMQVGSVNVIPQSANHMIVSLNGTIQKPNSSFTVSGSTITFSSNLATGDVIDFIQILGDVLDLGVPSDATVTTAKLADNAVTAAKITDSTITAAKLASGTVQNQSAFKNIIINGDMSQSQRGTSHTTASGYTLDRFTWTDDSTSAFTITQSTDVPSGQGFATSMKFDCTTANGSLGSSDQIRQVQQIEGQNLQYLKYGTSSAESLTCSFWVKSNKTGIYCVTLTQPDDSYAANTLEYTISSADTWEKKTVTFSGDTGGVINNDNGAGLWLMFAFGAGSGRHMTANQWNSSYGLSTSNQVNLADSTSNELYITGVQLEVGSAASDFEFLPTDITEDRCRRYYQIGGGCSGRAYSTTNGEFYYAFEKQMRSGPSVTLLDGTSIGEKAGKLHLAGVAGYNITNVSASNLTTKSINLNFTGSSLTSGSSMGILGNPIALDAEL